MTVHGLERRPGPIVTYLTGRVALSGRPLRKVFKEQFDVVHFHNISFVGGPGVLSYGSGVKLTPCTSTGSFARCTCSGNATAKYAPRRSACAVPSRFIVRRNSGAPRVCWSNCSTASLTRVRRRFCERREHCSAAPRAARSHRNGLLRIRTPRRAERLAIEAGRCTTPAARGSIRVTRSRGGRLGDWEIGRLGPTASPIGLSPASLPTWFTAS